MKLIRIATAASLLMAAALLASCAEDSEPTTTQPQPTSTTAFEPSEQFGFVRRVDGGTLVFDPAEILTGAEAVAAARAAGFIGPDEDLPNDFFISNPDSGDERKLAVANGADFMLIGFDAAGAITDTAVSFEELTAYLSGEADPANLYGFVPGDVPMTLSLSGDIVTAGSQLYLP